MGLGYNDIYVLSPERSVAAALKFLETFVPNREQSADDYVFSEGPAKPEIAFCDPMMAIHYCTADQTRSHSFYFRNTTVEEPAHAMLFFTTDGGLVLEISVHARQEDRSQETDEVAYWLGRLKFATDATIGFALHESPPPCVTIEEFVQCLSLALPPKLVSGNLVFPDLGDEIGVLFLGSS